MSSELHRDSFRLVEQYVGEGELQWRDEPQGRVRYDVSRYQAMSASGLPIPGLHRIEGRLELGAIPAARLVGQTVTLWLADGRSLRLTLEDATGRVLAEGHGPSKCGCC